jgi:hypothetical protein
MSLTTPHRQWAVQPGFDVTLSAGNFGGTIANWSLVGDPADGPPTPAAACQIPQRSCASETFSLAFAGIGAGYEVAVRLPGNISAVLGNFLEDRSRGSDVLFYGQERIADSFCGFGTILEGSWPVFGTSTIQLMLFNVCLAPGPQVFAVAEFLYEWLDRRSLDAAILNVAPAAAICASSRYSGLSAGVMGYSGRWVVRVPTDPRSHGRETIGHNF